MPTNMHQLIDANVARHREGAARQVARARAAIPKLSAAPVDTDRWRTPNVLDRYIWAVQLRIKYPKASVTELAQRAGMSRGRYCRILARALQMAEAMPEDDGELVLSR